MNLEEIRACCLLLPSVEESFPFDDTTLVFKVGGKMFLLLDLNSNPVEFNVKCAPGKAVELREQYTFVRPGFHMNKTHWNTITCETSVSKKLISEWINDSYNLVFASLTAKLREVLLAQQLSQNKKYFKPVKAKKNNSKQKTGKLVEIKKQKK